MSYKHNPGTQLTKEALEAAIKEMEKQCSEKGEKLNLKELFYVQYMSADLFEKLKEKE